MTLALYLILTLLLVCSGFFLFYFIELPFCRFLASVCEAQLRLCKKCLLSVIVKLIFPAISINRRQNCFLNNFSVVAFFALKIVI